MTSELLFYVFYMYMFANVIYDMKYRITKNHYHYPIAILLLIAAAITGQFIDTFLVGVCALIFFILFRNLPIVTFGAGDVKMLVNVFMFLNIVSFSDPKDTFLATIIVYFTTSLIGELVIRAVKGNWKGSQSHPEAPFIFVALTFVLIFFG